MELVKSMFQTESLGMATDTDSLTDTDLVTADAKDEGICIDVETFMFERVLYIA